MVEKMGGLSLFLSCFACALIIVNNSVEIILTRDGCRSECLWRLRRVDLNWNIGAT